VGGGLVQYCKGAPEAVLEVCSRIRDASGVRELTEGDRAAILGQNDRYADRALRVLGFSYRDVTAEEAPEEDLVFVGLQAMIDPPKDGVAASIATCHKAGIKVVMITGDHARTARAIAAEIGLYQEGDLVLTGHDVATMGAEELVAVVDRVSVFARVNPEHKLRIVEALRSNGHVIAMTGDGVNDAPALKNADIGVAMNSGTDVSKEAADMLLLDDNFTTIVESVSEGRHIFDNIRKFVRYLLSTNFGEVFTIFLASIVGFPLPLVAVQILWINLLTDGLPALSLAFEPRERSTMDRPPRHPKENIVDRPMMGTIVYIGLAMAVGTLLLYDRAPAGKGMTVAFTTLVLFQLFNVFNCRSFGESVASGGRNIYLWGAVALSVALQLCVIYLEPLNAVFYTVPLTAADWVPMIVVGASVVVLEEARKLVFRRKSAHA
jgi:Ca2+-transporting ATPase